tara:strand:+ start:373 stop:846 length:474 start_codon:yes stop_codon:yes gene_type:complete
MKEHPFYLGYFVTEDGNVFSNKHKNLKEMKQVIVNNYPAIIVCQNGIQTRKSVHRLVAETYLPNPNNLPCVNHIDENKTNNNLSNLEWVTFQQNSEYSNCPYRYTIQNVNTLELYLTNNLNQWCKEKNIQSGALLNTLTNKVKKTNQHKGYKLLSKM